MNKLEKDEVIVGCNSLSQLSQDNVLKKINFAGNNSPVGNLQRWVDGHFGNQSPIDFPRELTPPRTPVEDIVSPGLYAGKENHRSKEKLHAVIQGISTLLISLTACGFVEETSRRYLLINHLN